MTSGLILTMGLSPEPLIFTIQKNMAKYVVFIGTNESLKASVDKIIEDTGLKPSQYNKYEIIDNPNEIGSLCEKFQFAKDWLERQGATEIIADPTGGRKWMSAGAVMAASFLGIKMLYVDARYENRQIILESMRSIELGNAYDQTGFILAGKGKDDFNDFDFEGAAIHFKNITPTHAHKKEFFAGLARLCEVLARWDRFEHYGNGISIDFEIAIQQIQTAMKSMPENLMWQNFIHGLIRLKEQIKQSEAQEELNLFFITDLYLNAERCIVRNRFDDSLARQYRTLESLSQYFLKTHQIQTDKPDYTSLTKEQVTEFIKHCKDNTLPTKLDLKLGYWLLKVLGHPVKNLAFGPKQEFKNFTLEKLLQERNSSILAHGFKPIGKQKATDFFTKLSDVLSASLGVEFTTIQTQLKIPQMPAPGF